MPPLSRGSRLVSDKAIIISSRKIFFKAKMRNVKAMLAVFTSSKSKVVSCFRSFHSAEVLSHRQLPAEYEANQNIDNSLFYTTLPKKKRERKPKLVNGAIPSGVLAIECKREEFNHYSGMQYGKFDLIPLASKGWHHRKSKGDYFTILPTSEHSAFFTKEDLKVTFQENGVSERLVKQLKKLNITHPTVIQAKVLDKLLQGMNVFISAECGSGKTLAYVIAMIENALKYKGLMQETYNAPSVIILLPTRELAIQVGALISELGTDLGLNCHSLIGGDIKKLMLKPELTPVDILTSTLLALNRHLKAEIYSTKHCRHVVVDEVDSFVDDSFITQLKGFFFKSKFNFTGLSGLDSSSFSTQICFASAAVSRTTETTLSELIKGNPMDVVSTAHLNKVPRHVTQVFMRVGKQNKAEELLKIMRKNAAAKIPTMIFSNRLKTAYWLSLFLKENQIECGNLGNIGHSENRLRNYSDFEIGLIDIISCTDLASRGLDFKRVKQVINYEFPTFMIDYIHRCGRTGRLSQGENCKIISFISTINEIKLLQKIEKAIRTNSTLPGIYETRKSNQT